MDHYPDPKPDADRSMDPYANPSFREAYLEVWPSREEAKELEQLLIWALYGLSTATAEGLDEREYGAKIHVLPRALPRLIRVVADYIRNFRTKALVFREREMGDVKALVYDYVRCQHLVIVSHEPESHTEPEGFSYWVWAAYSEIKHTGGRLRFPNQDALRGVHVMMRDGARTHTRR